MEILTTVQAKRTLDGVVLQDGDLLEERLMGVLPVGELGVLPVGGRPG